MTFTSTEVYGGWTGQPVLDNSGHKVGKVSHIYVDDRTGQPEWLAVHIGVFQNHSSFVPLRGAQADGDKLVVAYDRQTIKQAPSVDDDGRLGPGDEQQLLGYYAGGIVPGVPAEAVRPELVDEPVMEEEREPTAGVREPSAGIPEERELRRAMEGPGDAGEEAS